MSAVAPVSKTEVALFFDRPESGERAVLVHLNLDSESEREDPREFEELVLSAGGDPAAYIMGHRTAPHPRTFIGSGKLEEIRDEVNLQEAEVVMFNHILSPSQERNLERELECRVLDRTGLILDIFAQRARTHEGKLQVELAQLQHVATRLVRGWTHLERQKGGIGLRGPGETQLETDRRLLRKVPPFRWWAIPMPVNRHCSTTLPILVCMLQTSCLPPLIRLCDG